MRIEVLHFLVDRACSRELHSYNQFQKYQGLKIASQSFGIFFAIELVSSITRFDLKNKRSGSNFCYFFLHFSAFEKEKTLSIF